MYSFKSEGIILSSKDYSEADRILHIFTKKHGKIVLIAKGVRRLTSKKRSSLEIFNQIKFSVSQTHGMGVLTEVEILNSHSSLKKSIKKVALAYYFSEVISRTTREAEPHEELYNYLLNTLKHLKYEHQLKKLRLEFVQNTLIILGFWPKGKNMPNPDKVLEEVTEKSFSTKRVGKKILE